LNALEGYLAELRAFRRYSREESVRCASTATVKLIAACCGRLSAGACKRGEPVVDRDVLSTRLNALEGYLAELRAFRRYSREEFVRESGLHHLAERFLHLACESVLDMAHHVISDEGYRQPDNYRDAMTVLAEQGVVETELARRLRDWMGFRNVLVHSYIGLDHGRSHDFILRDLGDLEDYARAMASLLADG
jgi:uncharacterized protein YutE (UPF0331/DUF86 family)